MHSTKKTIQLIKRCRQGLVIREVVMLTILPSILLSLLSLGVHATREAARRMSCQNNLKQHAIAMENFESAFNRIPSGCSSSLGGNVSVNNLLVNADSSHYAWGASLLPFLELDFEYSTLLATAPNDFSLNFQSPTSLTILASPFKSFRCPADAMAPPLNFGRAFEFDGREAISISLSNYVGNNGSGELSALTGTGKSNGLFYLNSNVRLDNISDGKANTIAFGERAWLRKKGSDYHSRAAVVFGVRSGRDNSYYGIADALAAGRYRLNFDAINQADGLGKSYLRRGFSSNHAGGAQFAFADASVRFISQHIDADMDRRTQTCRTASVDSAWEQLLSSNDGQAVGSSN